jgi:hypothetical protein
MAKNYTYEWEIKERGFVEVSEAEYTERQKEHGDFIKALSDVVVKAKCGWDGVKYKVMKNKLGHTAPYMVLYVGDNGERWIPVEGNSMGCNLQVLGENLW